MVIPIQVFTFQRVWVRYHKQSICSRTATHTQTHKLTHIHGLFDVESSQSFDFDSPQPTEIGRPMNNSLKRHSLMPIFGIDQDLAFLQQKTLKVQALTAQFKMTSCCQSLSGRIYNSTFVHRSQFSFGIFNKALQFLQRIIFSIQLNR